VPLRSRDRPEQPKGLTPTCLPAGGWVEVSYMKAGASTRAAHRARGLHAATREVVGAPFVPQGEQTRSAPQSRPSVQAGVSVPLPGLTQHRFDSRIDEPAS